MYFDEKDSFYDPIKDTVLVAGDNEVIISTSDDVVNDNSDDNDNNIPPVSEIIPPVNDDVVEVTQAKEEVKVEDVQNEEVKEETPAVEYGER